MSNHNYHLPEGWQIKKLGDIAKISYGYTAKASYEKGDSQFLRITDIQNDRVNWLKVPYCSMSPTDFDKYRLIDKDIVFARTGATTGKSYLVNNPPQAVAASYLIRLRLNISDILSEFIIKYFQTYEYWNRISIGISGSTQGGFNASKLGELLIPIPPLEVQKRIVEILDEAFEGIEKAIANTKQNLINARELFDSYLNNIFTTKGDDWVEKKLGDVCEVIAGQSPESKYYNNEGVGLPFYQGKKGFTDKYIGSPQTWTTKITKEALSDDILMSVRAPVGPINFATEKVCIGRGLAAIRAGEKINLDFLFYILLDKQKEIKGTEGAVFASINKGQIESINIPIPPFEVQKRIVNKFDNLSTETQRLEGIYKRKLELLEELKQSILERAFRGELTVNK